MARTGLERRPEDEVVVVGARPHPLRALFRVFLLAPWPRALGVVALLYLGTSFLFAIGYVLVGGVEEVASGDVAAAFFFSVQTMSTVGYGVMHPASPTANVLVVAQSIVGLLVTALSTGLVFAKFALVRASFVFADRPVVTPVNGVPTLVVRLGNDAGSPVVEAQVRVTLVRTERTTEGHPFYRMTDLALARERVPALSRSWHVMHAIDAASPLAETTPDSAERDEVELYVAVVGLDEFTLSPVFGRCRYVAADLAWGARYEEALRERPDGRLELDMGVFDRIVPSDPTDAFPYRWSPPPSADVGTTSG